MSREEDYCQEMDLRYLSQRLRRLEEDRLLLLRHLTLIYGLLLVLAMFILWRTGC